jgi:hypothetical protein
VQLQVGGHPNRDLQRDWSEYGEDAFTFEILDTMVPKEGGGVDPAGELAVLEQIWMEKLVPYAPNGYNRRPKP